MNNNIVKKLYHDLEIFSNFSFNSNYTEKFLETVDKIVLMQNPKSIKHLLTYFDDSTNYEWVFQSVIRSMEYYPNDIYVREILRWGHLLIKKAKFWYRDILVRILNNKDCLYYLKNNIYLADHKSMLEVLNIIKQRSKLHNEIISDLKEKILNNQMKQSIDNLKSELNE